ncbi:MAG: L-seryl-tRNA(Sec) selenium transferase [Campylobacter sp.]|nr:L-seryl-tRNA(Sec) selenium transferase [Campylobacter sp.]
MKIQLPQIDKLANLKEFEGAFRPKIIAIAKSVLECERQKALSRQSYKSFDEIVSEIASCYDEFEALSLRPIINATGVVLHTNLGRSAISSEVLKRALKASKGYSNLEYDTNLGKRAWRYSYTSELFNLLCGSEEALIVNNNASAVFLVLNTFAKARQTIVSRGELVEIGGGFRIPEVMSSSLTNLIEVGTTNKTKLKDYEEAINENTAMLMKVHKSNFAILGFSDEVSISKISNLSSKFGLISYYDMGSTYINELPFNLGKDESPLGEILKTGVDLVSFSGDKLFGSVQCGIILGKKSLIAKLKQNQLLRMLRVDKITLSILNETIKAYLNKEFDLITTTHQIYKTTDELKSLATSVKNSIILPCEVVQTSTFIGGGSMPCKSYPSVALAFDGNTQELESKFRKSGVIGRIENGKFLLDFRTILDDEIDSLIKICNEI